MRKTETDRRDGLAGGDAAPSPDTLQAFVRGELAGEEAERIAAWLEAHPDAFKRLSAGGGDPAEDGLADDLRWAKQLRDETTVDIGVPLTRLRELLPEYEILEEIGRGGMGIVFRARHLRLERDVAIKVLPALLGAVRPEGVARFRREAALAARLRHNNIIAVHDYGEAEGTLYYTMDLVDGRSLRDVLSEIEETGAIDVVIGGGPPVETSRRQNAETSKEDEAVSHPPSAPTSDIRHPTSHVTRLDSSSGVARQYYRRITQWMADVAEALQHAHEQGVIHRDMKPSNLVLGADGRVMITDFGLARSEDHPALTASGALLGTARYMSPEQVDPRRGRIDARTDVYGLGATMYEFLAFRPMFGGERTPEVLRQVLDDEPTRPRRIIGRVPAELETICLKAVEKEPARRYQSARAFADDLRRWLLDLPISARRPSLPTRAAKFVRRRRVVSALAASLAIVLMVSGILYAGYHSSRRQEAETRAVAASRGLELLVIETRSLLREGRYTAGLARIDAGLAQWDNAPELLRIRAKTLGRMGRDAEALRTLEALLARDPDDWQTHYILASVYAYRPARQEGDTAQLRLTKPWAAMSQEEIDAKADHHRQQVERLMPQTPEAFYIQACSEEDPRRAVELLNRAVAVEPSRYEFIAERADQYFKLKEYDAMLLDAERAAMLRTGWASAHATRGRALLNLKRYEESIAAYDRAIELDPKEASYWHNRGVVRLEAGRFKGAIADASQAIRLDPQYARPYGVRGPARAGLGDLDEGIQDCDRAITLNPTDVGLYEQRLGLYAEAARWEDVIADASVMIQLRPTHFAGYEHRAIALMNVQQPKRAIADCNRLVGLRPEFARGFGIRAIAHMRTGQFAKAIEDYTRGIEIVPNASPDIYSRAKLYLRTGQYPQAVSDLTQVIRLEPQSTSAVLTRGMAYELTGATQLALADYERATAVDGPTGAYASLWKYILLYESGRKDEAADAIASRTSLAQSGTWTDRLFDLFMDELAPDDLLTTAVTDDERAEAYYYIARKALLDGRPDEAKDAFTKCVALDRDKLLETDFARALLKQSDRPGAIRASGAADASPNRDGPDT